MYPPEKEDSPNISAPVLYIIFKLYPTVEGERASPSTVYEL
jgi:hypothetical protein